MTYGIYLFSRSKATINWSKVFLNPGTFSTFVGLIILFLPISMPSGIANTLESLGKMTVPLSMILIGSLIADVKYNDFPLLLKNKYIWKAALAKLLIVPLLLLPFAFLSVPLPLLTIAVLVAGMPSAPTISIYAQEYNGDTLFASIGVIVSSLLCVITIPFYILSYLFKHPNEKEQLNYNCSLCCFFNSKRYGQFRFSYAHQQIPFHTWSLTHYTR